MWGCRRPKNRHCSGRAISAEFLTQEGWSEGANGEILNSRGRKLFDIGFINAIKKTLAS
ncbi:gamma-mobile-trio protein GmtX [Massilia sp. Root351]|uniref:gamma-mobile-trio protein GmtX n=1 Tax=Massilia sp. Root351 TaxID=1736522 RepID=UPI0035A3142E